MTRPRRPLRRSLAISCVLAASVAGCGVARSEPGAAPAAPEPSAVPTYAAGRFTPTHRELEAELRPLGAPAGFGKLLSVHSLGGGRDGQCDAMDCPSVTLTYEGPHMPSRAATRLVGDFLLANGVVVDRSDPEVRPRWLCDEAEGHEVKAEKCDLRYRKGDHDLDAHTTTPLNGAKPSQLELTLRVRRPE